MKQDTIKHLLTQQTVILDGATGSNLQEAGMKMGVCPEQWILENPEAILKLQREYSGRNQYSLRPDLYRKPYQTGRIWIGG